MLIAAVICLAGTFILASFAGYIGEKNPPPTPDLNSIPNPGVHPFNPFADTLQPSPYYEMLMKRYKATELFRRSLVIQSMLLFLAAICFGIAAVIS